MIIIKLFNMLIANPVSFDLHLSYEEPLMEN